VDAVVERGEKLSTVDENSDLKSGLRLASLSSSPTYSHLSRFEKSPPMTSCQRAARLGESHFSRFQVGQAKESEFKSDLRPPKSGLESGEFWLQTPMQVGLKSDLKSTCGFKLPKKSKISPT
jgi:hypothetical protein